jgi:hypothetical protein
LIHTTTKETKHHIVGWMQENRTKGDFIAHTELFSLFTAPLSCWRERSIGRCDNSDYSILSQTHPLLWGTFWWDDRARTKWLSLVLRAADYRFVTDMTRGLWCCCSRKMFVLLLMPLQSIKCLGIWIIVECWLWRWFVFQWNKCSASPSDCRLYLGQCNIRWWQQRSQWPALLCWICGGDRGYIQCVERGHLLVTITNIDS